MYGTFSLNASAFNVLRGIIRNYAELYLFLNLAESLCSAQGAEHGGTSRLASRIVSNPVGHKPACRSGIQHRHVSIKVGRPWLEVYSRSPTTRSRAALAVLLNTGMAFTGCLRGVCVAFAWRWSTANAAHYLGEGYTGTRTSKNQRFLLIRAYAEIPLRGMITPESMIALQLSRYAEW